MVPTVLTCLIYADETREKKDEYFDIWNDVDDEARHVLLRLHSPGEPLHHGFDGDVRYLIRLYLIHARLAQLLFEHLADGDAVEAVQITQVVDVPALLRARAAEYENDSR